MLFSFRHLNNNNDKKTTFKFRALKIRMFVSLLYWYKICTGEQT